MNMFLRKILLSLLICLSGFQAFNCGWGPDSHDMRVCNFMQDLPRFAALNNFVFTYSYYNGDLGSYMGDYTQNINQWHSYLGDSSVKKSDIYEVLYLMNKDDYDRHQNVNLENNTFLKAIKANKAAFEYLHMIKHRSEATFKSTWDEFAEGYGNFYGDATVDAKTCDSLFKRCKDPYLKKRYAYQLLVCNFYGNDTTVLQELYNTYFQDTQKDWLDYSAQYYYAFAHEKHDSLWLDCFMYGADKTFSTAREIYSSENFAQRLHTEKDPTKLSYLMVIKALRDPGRSMPALQKIQQLDPNNRYMDFLITREINKIEDWILTPQVGGFESYVANSLYEENANYGKVNNWHDDLRYAHHFATFLNELPHSNESKLFRALAKVYINAIAENKISQQAFLNVDEFEKGSSYYLQAKFLNLVIQLKTGKVSPHIEAEILELLQLSDKDKYFKYQFIRTLSQFMLANDALRAKGFLLMAQGRLPKHIPKVYVDYTFYTDIFENATVQDLTQIVALIRKKDKTPFEVFITKPVKDFYYHYYNDEEDDDIRYSAPIDTLKILDIMAIKHIQKDQLEPALQVYNTFPKEYWLNHYFDDPFTFDISDGHNHQKRDKAGYTKKAFLEKLISYKQQLMLQPTDPLLNYYVGNAYMSLTYYGKNWYMYDNYLSGHDECVIDNTPKGQNYYGCAKAIACYKTGLQYAKDDKLKILLSFNLAYCLEQTQKKPFEKSLSSSASVFYEMVKTNCDLYEDYLGKYRHVEKDYATVKQGTLKGFMSF